MQSLTLWLMLIATGIAGEPADYQQHIRPLLHHKCVSCHGPLRQEAGLRLDAIQLIRQGSENGPVVVAGRPEASPLLERVQAEDFLRMPPEGEGSPLSAEQVALLRTWIATGLAGPAEEPVLSDPKDHWAYHPPKKVELPPVSESDSTNPIDRLLRPRLKEQALAPLPLVDRATLLRRVSLDLVGLPPSRQQLHEFLNDPDPNAYERVVDELLASPEYGQRWGRHWMDVWRYSDWDGYKQQLRSSQRHVWRWRDWIVESLNADRGYDEMLQLMLAADELKPNATGDLRATGFLARQHHALNRDLWLENTVEHTFRGFLGTTLQCAKCHDHKYDPLKQTDYYHARAIFESYGVRLDRVPGSADPQQNGLARAYDAYLDRPTYLYVQGNEKQPDKAHPLSPAVPAIFAHDLTIEPLTLPQASYYPHLREFVVAEQRTAAEAKVSAAAKKLAEAQAALLAWQVPTEMSTSPGDEAGPTLEVLLRAPATTSLAEARHALAAAELQALTARTTAEQAKYGGSSPSQVDELARMAVAAERELALAQAKVQRGTAEQQLTGLAKLSAAEAAKAYPKIAEQLKKARAAVTAAAEALAKPPAASYTPLGPVYPQNSTGRRLAFAQWVASRQNPLTARVAVNHIWLRHFGTALVESVDDFGLRAPRPEHQELLDWLAVQFMDDGWQMKPLHKLIVLSEAYRRASSVGANSSDASQQNLAIDPDNHFYWRQNPRRLEAEAVRDSVLHVAGLLDLSHGGPDLDFAEGERVYRRSLYFRHAYEKQMTFLLQFDAASPSECYRRKQSIVPQQALALTNSSLAHAAAEKLAKQLASEFPAARDAFITAAFEQVLSRTPRENERQLSETFFAEQVPRLTESLGDEVKAEGHARRLFVHVLLNHNDFVTVR